MNIWFHFDDGSNPYHVLSDRDDLFFNMLLAYNVEIKPNIYVDGCTFQCHETRPYIYSHKVATKEYRKETIKDFAEKYLNSIPLVNYTEEDLLWFAEFFTKYGRRYKLLPEFRELGIC